jgi:hypothetical protein
LADSDLLRSGEQDDYEEGGDIMGDYMKGILGSTNAVASIMLIDKVSPLLAVGFTLINVLLLVVLVAHISRYLHNRVAV